MEKPIFSIITVTLNNSRTIKRTLDSINNQSLKAFEHIVVDGGSSDSTIEIIKKESPYSRVLFLPRSTIYQALNHGIQNSKGTIITWLHADDFYSSRYVLEKVLKIFVLHRPDLVYGDIAYINKNGEITRLWRAGAYSPKKLNYGWMPPHTSIFVKKNYLDGTGYYNTSFKQSADYEWILRAFLINKPFAFYMGEITVVMEEGGVSNKRIINRIKAHIEDYRAWIINKKSPLPSVPLKVLIKIPQFFMFRKRKLFEHHLYS